jgi:hypothetical protein
MKTYQTIEFGNGATYRNNRYTVYEHSTYPRSSVLAGQRRRVWMDDFATLEEAKAAYPQAQCSGATYQPPYLEHLPDDEDPGDLYAENWMNDDNY